MWLCAGAIAAPAAAAQITNTAAPMRRPGAARAPPPACTTTVAPPPQTMLGQPAATARTKRKPGLSEACDPNSWHSAHHMAYEGELPAMVQAIQERYKWWAPLVMWILKLWRAFSEMRSILKEPWPERTCGNDEALQALKVERARRFFFAGGHVSPPPQSTSTPTLPPPVICRCAPLACTRGRV